MEKTTFKGGTMLSPTPPTMVSCGERESANIITVAWTGIMCTNPAVTYVAIRPSRHSYDIIEKTREFVINLVPSSLTKVCDLCGVKSGRDVNKWEICNLHPQKATAVNAPMIEECPVNLECRVREKISLGTHDVFIADILAVNVDSKLIDENGKIRLWKADLIAYSHGSYYTLGRHLGDFGFSVKKKKKRSNH